MTFESDDTLTPGEPDVDPSHAVAEATEQTEPVVASAATEAATEEESASPVEAVVAEPDEALLAAHDLAYAALLEITPAASIGKPAGHLVEADGVVSLMFETTLLGYPGWFWTVSLARVAGDEPTVLEAELLPGEKALVAPDWVPWAVRLAEYQAAQAAAAESAVEDDDADDDLDDDIDDDELDFDPDDMHSEDGDDLNGIDIDALGDIDAADESDDDADNNGEANDDDAVGSDADTDKPVVAAAPEKKRRRLSWRRLRR